MPRTTPRHLRRLAAAALAPAAALALAACGAGGAEVVPPTLDDVVSGDVATGTDVTVSARVDRIVGDDALLLRRDGPDVLVVDAPAASGPAIDRGEEVVVVGEVRPLDPSSLSAATRSKVDLSTVADRVIDATLVRERLSGGA